MQTVILQFGSAQTIAAVTAAVVTALIGLLLTTLRYVFDVQLTTEGDVRRMIAEVNASRQDDFDEIIRRLDDHKEALENLEQLIMGGEYQVSDGMLELVEINAEDIEDHDERIDGVERIQLKIRRRQREHTGGENVADPEDVDPPPEYGEKWGEVDDETEDT